VRRWACLGTATALACLSCGESADSNGDGGTGGAPPSCFDLVLTPEILPDPENWLWGADALPSSLFASSAGLHVVWVADRFYPNGKQGSSLEGTSPIPIVTTIALDGVVSHQARPLLPEGITYPDGRIDSVAGRSDGTFAIGYEWREAGVWHNEVALLRLDETEPYARVVLPAASAADDLGPQTHAAWDGEAFAMHAYGIPPQFSLFVARVSAEGELLLPFTRYGETVNVGYGPLGHKTATSAESGRSYVLDGGYSVLLSGHLRDGDRLPGTEGGAKVVDIEDVFVGGTTPVAVAADPTGAWLSAKAGGAELAIPVQRTNLDGAPQGPPLLLDPFVGGGIVSMAMLPLSDSLVLLLGSGTNIHRQDLAGGKLSKPVALLDGTKWGDIDIRQMSAVQWNGETWLTYHQASYAIHVRLLKATPGCVYVAEPPGLPDGT